MKIQAPGMNPMRQAANAQFERIGWDKKEHFDHEEVSAIIVQCVDAITLDKGIFSPEVVGEYWLQLASNLRAVSALRETQGT